MVHILQINCWVRLLQALKSFHALHHLVMVSYFSMLNIHLLVCTQILIPGYIFSFAFEINLRTLNVFFTNWSEILSWVSIVNSGLAIWLLHGNGHFLGLRSGWVDSYSLGCVAYGGGGIKNHFVMLSTHVPGIIFADSFNWFSIICLHVTV